MQIDRVLGHYFNTELTSWFGSAVWMVGLVRGVHPELVDPIDIAVAIMEPQIIGPLQFKVLVC